ncbi:MAG: glycosyltransferase [Gallionellaceae bacterium]|nr:glycosyltransferase [Gallionellaceae bacterium]
MPKLSISVVSHAQTALVQSLLADISCHCDGLSVEVILTLNVEESLAFDVGDYPFPIRIIRNSTPKGFGVNHNAAFNLAKGMFFCVINPDIRFSTNPFDVLVGHAKENNVGLVAPLIVDSRGREEDSARRFPSPLEIILKIFGGKSAVHTNTTQALTSPDWVAGMFMLFPREVFQRMGGFNERYFLYYEDVDLCARLTLAGLRVLSCSEVSVVHDARRSSHKNPKFMFWHVLSMFRYFSSDVYKRLQQRPMS